MCWFQVLDESNSLGTPALVYAVRLGRIDACRCLLRAGASVNIKETTSDADTSLHFAFEAQQKDVFELLSQ